MGPPNVSPCTVYHSALFWRWNLSSAFTRRFRRSESDIKIPREMPISYNDKIPLTSCSACSHNCALCWLTIGCICSKLSEIPFIIAISHVPNHMQGLSYTIRTISQASVTSFWQRLGFACFVCNSCQSMIKIHTIGCLRLIVCLISSPKVCRLWRKDTQVLVIWWF